MTPNERIAVCKTCKNQSFNSQKGIVCGLTNEKANFSTECADYVADQEKIEKEAKQEKLNLERAEQANKGKQVLMKLFFCYLLLLVLGLIVDLFISPSANIGQFLIRETLTFGLFFAIYYGYKWAKNVTSILFLLGFVFFIVPTFKILSVSIILGLPLLCLLVFYGLCIYHLNYNKNVESFLKSQQR
jgi:uncharacterized membrane protein